jgi:hypothetical protein
MTRHYITCEYDMRQVAKNHGCRWDAAERRWYAETPEIAAKAQAAVNARGNVVAAARAQMTEDRKSSLINEVQGDLPEGWRLSEGGVLTVPAMRSNSAVSDRMTVCKEITGVRLGMKVECDVVGNSNGHNRITLAGVGTYHLHDVAGYRQSAYSYNKHGGDDYTVEVAADGAVIVSLR